MTGLEFRVLGPIEVVGPGGAIRLGGRRQRAVLAILLLRANRVVPVEQIADEVYGGRAPPTAVGQVRDHVSQLRKLFGANGDGDFASQLETQAPGYLLRVEPEQLDWLRFEHALEAATDELRRGDATAAATRLRGALELWRGPALADLAEEQFARPDIERLEELRLAALGQRIEADLELGRHAALVGELDGLVVEHPLREEFRRQLMLALYRSGRHAEAVETYHAARRALMDELGIQPSPELRELMSQILRQDRALDAPPVSAGEAAATPASNPYKGLRAFLESDADDFHGREALIERLVERMRAARFLAVVGPSGSGKSSVVRAGLVPAMRSYSTQVVAISPGAYPLEELEAALLRIAVNPPPMLLPQLEEDDRGLLRAAKRVLPDDGSELLLVIDQLEELFTLAGDERGREHFLAIVERAVTDPLSRLRVVTTIRADFYDRPLRHLTFAELLRDSVEIVPPLSPDELERAITAPARRVGVRLEDGLLAEIVADVLEEPGALPLLQFALTELFDRREGSLLTRTAYTAVGGVSGALAHQAESLYSGQTDSGKEATRQLFLRLVTLGDGSDTRRRAERAELASLDVDQRELDVVIDAFGAARLLSFDRELRTREPTVEVAHEALLENWERLRDWIDVAREDIALRRRVTAAAAEWRDAGRDDSFLLRGLQLDRVEAAGARSNLAQTELEREYVAASLAMREGERAAARRSLTRLRTLAVALLVVSVAAAAAAVFAFTLRARSDRHAKVATARQLAAASVANLGVDPDLSILLAMRAVETSPGGDGLPEAADALHRAIENSRVVLRIPDAGRDAVTFSPDGSRLATAGNGAAVWDDHSGRRLFLLRPPSVKVHDIAYSGDGSQIATGGDDGAAIVWNANTGAKVAVLRHGLTQQVSVSFNPDGTKLATDDYSGDLDVWNLRRRTVERTFHSPHALCGVSWSPDGSLVGAGDCGTNYATASGRVWDERTGKLVYETKAQLGAALTLAFSPDGTEVATPNLDGTAAVWNARTGRLEAKFTGHTGPVYALAFSPNGKTIATGGADGTARVWDSATGVQELVLPGHRGIVNDVAFSPDGSRLATVSEDGTARVWNVSPSGSRDWLTLAAHPGGVESAYFSPDGKRLLTAGEVDGKAKLWNARTGALLSTYKNPIEAAFRFTPADRVYFSIESTSPDGAIGASARSNGTIRLSDATTGAILRTLPSRHQGISALAFSSDGKRVASGYWDGTAVVWDVASGRPVRTITAQDGDVDAIAFSPDGRLLATAGEDAQTRLWDLRTGDGTLTLGGPELGVTDVKFSPDGTRLATASRDGLARVYVLPVPQLLAIARKRLTRGWRPEECMQFLQRQTCPKP